MGRAFEWIFGIIGAVIAGLLTTWLTGSWPMIAAFFGFVTITPEVWREDRFVVPVSLGNGGKAADLDAGRLLAVGTSVSAAEVDLIVRQSVHGVVMEPGLPNNGTDTYNARFTRVSDNKVGRDECKDASVAAKVSNHLQLESEIRVGSHVCMVTTQGRLAEFEITNVDLSPTKRQVEIKTVVWIKN
jgi:hypothetical protein